MHPRYPLALLPAARFGYGLLSLLLAMLALGFLLSGFSTPAANSGKGYINHSDQALVASHQGSRLRFAAPAPDSGDNSPLNFPPSYRVARICCWLLTLPSCLMPSPRHCPRAWAEAGSRRRDRCQAKS
jgi:hypothetical protein